MTSISAVGHADVGAVPKVKSRNLSLDRARTFLTLVVLTHHAVIPYTYFGHTDPKYFFGFDMIVLATDSFFMAMFFFLSGLFAWSGIARKGAPSYLADRLLRLGLPFVICALTVIPLSLHGRRRPAVFFAVMLAVTAAFYVPGLMIYGPASWFEFGPFSVQHGRVMLYASYFFFGAGIGVAQMDRGLLAADGRMAKVSWDWMVLTIVPYCLLWVLIFIKREILGNPSSLPNWYEALYAICFTVFSVAIMFLLLAFYQRFRQSGSAKLLDPMQADAYGMFLVHYPIVLWLQYWLFDYDLPAIVKATIGFVLTVALSGALTRALRKIPGATKVL